MGALTSRQHAGVEEADVVSNHAYKYPPRSGNYFGSHFIMGGERFDTPQPEAYLFGENADLNFLGSRPTPFPYPPPQSNEPTKTLKSLVNIRKESLRFVRCPEPVGKLADNKISDGMKAGDCNGKGTYYNIEFTFDCDARCAITVFYFCTEEVTPSGVVYYSRDSAMTSQTYHYKKGANQQFCQISHVFDPSKYSEEDLLYNPDREIIPIAIYCVVDEGQEEIRQSHTTIAVVEKHSDGTYVLKALKQKLFVDGLCYLLQEIYGIENKNLDTKPSSDEETEDGGSECVICMCDVRDTLILPCRHLCLCNSCADSLRYQANNCPICRAPFRALLQIRALQKAAETTTAAAPATPADHVPAGYEPVSLLEALNGPHPARPLPPPPRLAPAIASPDTDTASQAAEILNRCNLERSSSTSLGSSGSRKAKNGSKDDIKSTRDRSMAHTITPEFRMSVLLAREEEAKRAEEKTAANSPLLYNHKNVNGTDKISKSSLSLDYPTDVGSAQDGSGSEDEVSLRAERASSVGRPDAGPDADPDADPDVDPDADPDAEPDSDAERLSPLLTQLPSNGILKSSSLRTSPCPPGAGARSCGECGECGECDGCDEYEGCGALRLSAPALAHIDDTDTDEPDHPHNYTEVYEHSAGGGEPRPGAESPAVAEDSDYFTPEDTTTTILTVPKHKLENGNNVADCAPQRWALPHHVTSLPGTPLSQSSVRSSGDSYSSTSSTRQLLAPAGAPLAADSAC
ncbi:E3 ubiquitin-protein ligase MGRN1 [Achroia grisella]|uniref:E3 ubiquitin-protein ligase MGRN1 n=1 Tax=Achroia grisella TaxID=688607 RepID=UPI0027D28A2D|nr:E3 ubiquitin-protein ligase MGRN1 [Achroia grisella]